MSCDRGYSKRIIVGLALLQKKHRSFVRDSLVKIAEEEGIELVAIDVNCALSEQGPFDAILHKIPNDPQWNQHILSFSESHPEVVVIDPPDAIERLNNRMTMLQLVENLRISEYSACDSDANDNDGKILTVGIPKQCVVSSEDDKSPEDLAKAAELSFPIITKPLVADGTTDSHAMSIIFNPESLSKLKPPVVLQEFINHGGVIFKVYVVGNYCRCVNRRSLPDIILDDLKDGGREPLAFRQISNTSIETDPSDPNLKVFEFPPDSFISSVASSLGKALGLHLFNFDIIRDSETPNHYYIIDINYFPGYEKMPDYERILTDFFLSFAKN